MALAPRCAFIGGSGVTSVTSISPALTGWTNLAAGPSGTAPQTGDFVLILGVINNNADTASQSAGTGAWTFQSTGDHITAAPVNTTFVAWRIFDGTETTPTFGWTTGARTLWAMIAVAPDPSSTVSIDAWATLKQDTTAGTSHTANGATAAAGGELSLILSGLWSATTGAANITVTEPSGWTQAALSVSGDASHNNGAADIAYKAGVGSGAVAPAAETTSLSTDANLYQVLIAETSTAPVNTVFSVSDPEGFRLPGIH